MTDRRVPPLLVEKLRLGELGPEEAARVRAQLGDHAVPDGPSDAEVFADDPPAAVAREVRRRVAEATWADRRRAGVRLVGAVAVAAAVLLAVRLPLPPEAGPADDVRLKGDVLDLRVLRDGPEGPERLGPTDVAGAGDRLQLGFAAHGLPHGVLLSVDGRGVVTEHARWAGEARDDVTLPTAYVLDDAPAFEAFVLVASPVPLDVDVLLADLRARGPSAAPPAVDVPGALVETFVLPKVPR